MRKFRIRILLVGLALALIVAFIYKARMDCQGPIPDVFMQPTHEDEATPSFVTAYWPSDKGNTKLACYTISTENCRLFRESGFLSGPMK